MKLFNEKLTNFLVTKHGVKKNDTFTYSNCGKLKNKGNLGMVLGCLPRLKEFLEGTAIQQ